jgi:hypothetical protein
MDGAKTPKRAPVAQADPEGSASRPVPPFSGPPVFSWPAPARPPGDRPQRRRPGQDLIGELFETMHELHFLPELVTGCDFVLAVVQHMVPCAAVMVHVFDIDARQFVTVRASGPGADKLVLCRTPNTDPLLGPVMRQGSARRIDQAQGDARFAGGRWALLGVVPEAVLSVPVVQAGRHLGAIELVNPDGGGGFHQNEAHGLEYIAEQFAEFLAKRPIVLDPDSVRAQS